MTPLNFLNLLWQLKPEEMFVLIWTLHDKCSHWFRDVAAAAEFVPSKTSSKCAGMAPLAGTT